MILGYFASIDSSLHRMRNGFFENHQFDVTDAKSFPVSQKLNLFLSTTVLLITLATAVSAYSYINIDLKNSGIDSAEGIKQEFIVDTLFILGLVISLTTRIIFSYSVNLQHMFETQINVLKNAQEGQLEHYVPVLSRDEFGIIAQQTNKMINQLREKEKIQKTLERIVSPNIMRKLLQGNSAELKQGKEYNLAILFCDLRKFTSYAESTPPEEVIFFLNAYFTKIADIVAEHGGIVNKFIGDAILAVFGVEEEQGYVERAVDTAWDIMMHTGAAVMRDGSTFDIGIGIHVGKAAAGTIGSADRFEYTFIGDAVNTASRLDGLSKRLGHKVIVSSDVYKVLHPDKQAKFTDLGEQAIRGKSLPLHVYGAVQRDCDPQNKIVNFEPKKTAV
jgi:adenylate cyclase